MRQIKHLGLIMGFVAGIFIVIYCFLPKHPSESQDSLVKNHNATGRIQMSYSADYNNNRILVGASHNIFVAKIIRKTEIRDYYIIPDTMYEAEVIYNIKGDLKGNILLGQEGGYKNGKLYLMDNGISENEYFLKPGETYLLATRYSPGGNWHLLNSHPNARKLISSDNLTQTQLESIAQADSKVKSLIATYPNEILLDADVKHNNAYNSYRSLNK